MLTPLLESKLSTDIPHDRRHATVMEASDKVKIKETNFPLITATQFRVTEGLGRLLGKIVGSNFVFTSKTKLVMVKYI